MPNIVMFNLAEKELGGPTAKTLETLQKKYPPLVGGNAVQDISLFKLMRKYQKGEMDRKTKNVPEVRLLCMNADKIYLCVHGQYNDTDNGFANFELGGRDMRQVTDWKSLALFMLLLLPKRSEAYNISLVMCYGARTQDFMLDQNALINNPRELQTSFAYKFFATLYPKRPLRLSARTGAVQFDPVSGHSKVERDEVVQLRAEKDEYLREQEAAGTFAKYIELRKTMTTPGGGGTEKTAMKFLKMDNKFRDNPEKSTSIFSKNEKIIRAYHQAVSVKTHYDGQMIDGDSEKYGKIIYTCERDELVIISKYLRGGTELYRGNWLPVG
jgi:hypothetical protein